VLVCLGQDAEIVEYPQSSGIFAIHIIQDRMTGKTHDVYLEFTNFSSADNAYRRYENLSARNREPKLGSRRVNLNMSTNTELMKVIFPRAKCEWIDGMPVRSDEYLRDNPSEWDGFITNEELLKVLLFAEQITSSKTRFAVENPERVYQFMMSSLQKIPWKADRSYFPKAWCRELHRVLGRMSLRLANLAMEGQYMHLNVKLLTQFMTTIKCCGLYTQGDRKAMDMYMDLAEKVDYAVGKYKKAISNPRRGTIMANGGMQNTPLRIQDGTIAGAQAPDNRGDMLTTPTRPSRMLHSNNPYTISRNMSQTSDSTCFRSNTHRSTPANFSDTGEFSGMQRQPNTRAPQHFT
jgi:hypothetical protein